MERRRWSSAASAAVVGAGLVAMGLPVWAAEHGGQEHGGQSQVETPEHGGVAQTAPSAQQIRDRIAAYIQEREAAEGAFTVPDEVTGTTRTLTLVRVHERVGKTGELYYACTDMQDTETSELLDLDFDIEASDGQLKVVDTRIHKVSGEERYTYDEHDNRIPVVAGDADE